VDFIRPGLTGLVRQNRRQIDREHAARLGLSLTRYEAKVRRHLRELYRQADVCVRITAGDFEEIIASGGLKSAHDVDGMCRTLNRWERMAQEPHVFTEPPIYGYLSSGDESAREEGETCLGRFGSVRLDLKRSVRSRATTTLGYAQIEQDGLMGLFTVPAPVDNPDALSCLPHVEPLRWTTVVPLDEPTGDSFIEAQIYGRVPLNEIAAVTLLGEDDHGVRELAESAGLPVRHVPLSESEPAIRHWIAYEAFAPAQSRFTDSGIHGDAHWRQVADNGLRLAEQTPGADLRVVLLFALLHDVFRRSEDADPEHGLRAARFVADDDSLTEHLGADAVRELVEALAFHDDGLTSTKPTVGCCWDADRLDLPRVGITPEPAFMSTTAGQRACATKPPGIEPPLWRTLYLRVALAMRSTTDCREEVAA
jgi:uncharacterized protein